MVANPGNIKTLTRLWLRFERLKPLFEELKSGESAWLSKDASEYLNCPVNVVAVISRDLEAVFGSSPALDYARCSARLVWSFSPDGSVAWECTSKDPAGMHLGHVHSNVVTVFYFDGEIDLGETVSIGKPYANIGEVRNL